MLYSQPRVDLRIWIDLPWLINIFFWSTVPCELDGQEVQELLAGQLKDHTFQIEGVQGLSRGQRKTMFPLWQVQCLYPLTPFQIQRKSRILNFILQDLRIMSYLPVLGDIWTVLWSASRLLILTTEGHLNMTAIFQFWQVLETIGFTLSMLCYHNILLLREEAWREHPLFANAKDCECRFSDFLTSLHCSPPALWIVSGICDSEFLDSFGVLGYCITDYSSSFRLVVPNRSLDL